MSVFAQRKHKKKPAPPPPRTSIKADELAQPPTIINEPKQDDNLRGSNSKNRLGNSGSASAGKKVPITLQPIEIDAEDLLPEETVIDDTESAGLPTVVRVFATYQEPDYENPWQMQPIAQGSGSGVVVEHGRILTAAHVIANHTFIEVEHSTAADFKRCYAKVYAVSHESDLALLELDPDGSSSSSSVEDFMKDVVPAQIGTLPRLRDKVMVCGFPVGGEQLSITQGVVSRIEGQPYAHSHRVLLAVTVDAAINEGNSGGPVFSEDGKLTGIAFQSLVGAENTGHLIPEPVISHFLNGLKQKGPQGYEGFPSIGLSVQMLTNPNLRKHLGMSDDQSGVLVTEVMYGNTCDGVLKPGDVLTEQNGLKIANNGTVAFANRHRIEFSTALSLYQCGEKVKLKILRDKKVTEVEVVLQPPKLLVPLRKYDRLPTYFIYCGLVFQPLSLDYLTGVFGALEAPPRELTYLFEAGKCGPERTEVVILSQVLNDKINIGYDELNESVVTEVNGKKISDLVSMVKEIECTPTGTVTLKTSDDAMVLLPGANTDEAIAANHRILKRYRVPADRSEDLKDLCVKK